MANMHLHHEKCSKKLKTFQALVKHSKKCYVDRPILRRSVFFQDDKEVPLIAPQGIRSPTEICSIRSMSFHGKLADFRIQHGSYKVFSTVPQRSQKYMTPFI